MLFCPAAFAAASTRPPVTLTVSPASLTEAVSALIGV